jgi:UDP-N-acetylglucosamine/UDP-N-acetylgalactosamine diphosphorylase
MPPPSPLSAADRDLVARFERAGQGHVFRFLPELPHDEAAQLLDDARSIDLDLFTSLVASERPPSATGAVEPPGDELQRLDESDDYRRMRNSAHERGVHELEEGRVAVVVAAGGQGTRLGAAAPKALWPVGPLSGKPLLQWHAEKVLYWARRIGRPVPFLVLVSEATARTTEDFLRWHGHFGLDPTWVRLFRQRSLPPADDQGRMLLASRSRIALAPNGHGGVFAALRDARLLDLLQDHGVRTLAYCQVDNPLVRTLDPVFVGFHIRREAQFSSKSVTKRSPEERVGVFAHVGGRPAIVEYTELPLAQAREVDEEGNLLFGQGSIAAHCIDLEFARRMADEGLPYHRARKKVPFVDARGALVEPEEPNATKFEQFVFDALPRAERALVLETERALEFSSIKNATGEDTPDTARRDMIAMFASWYRRAALPLPAGPIEVSPLEAPDEHAFRKKHGLPWV